MMEQFVNNIAADFLQYVPRIPSVVFVIIFGIIAIRLIKATVGKMLRVAKLDPTLINFVTAFVSFACWVFIISLGFSVLGFSQISLAFSGSIALVIMGIATNAANLVQDLLAGIFLIAEPDFRVGQLVRINAVVGEIIGLDIKKTKVKDTKGDVHYIPNKMFDANIFVIENTKSSKEEKSA